MAADHFTDNTGHEMTDSSASGATGGCLCGAVRYRVEGPLGEAHACHCGQCRRQSGHYVVGVDVNWDHVRIEGEADLRWYEASPIARRGFCGRCGSKLFWVSEEYGGSIHAGSLDAPTGLTLKSHIFVADKGDYYEIADDLPKFMSYPGAEGDAGAT